MQDRKVAQRYAFALWKKGLEQNIHDKIKDELKWVTDVLSDEKIFSFFLSPKVKHSQKKEIINKVIGGNVSETVKSFLIYLISKGRIDNIHYICSAYNELWDAYENILEVEVKTAISLDDKLQKSLINKLESITGKKIILKAEVDKNIIGGVWIKINNNIIDGTLINSIETLKESLLCAK